MANDRIYLRCKGCGNQYLLLKYYPCNSYIWRPEEIQEWMDQHIADCNELGMGDLGGNPCFDLITESDDNWTNPEPAWPLGKPLEFRK